MLGEFGAVSPSPAMQEAVSQIIGYRLGAYGRNPSGMQVYTTLGGENSRFAAGTTLTLPVVFGHRDVAFTACPGNLGYATLPDVRARAQKVAFSAAARASALPRHAPAAAWTPRAWPTWTGALLGGASGLGPRRRHRAQRGVRAAARRADAYMEILGRGPDPPAWRRGARRSCPGGSGSRTCAGS